MRLTLCLFRVEGQSHVPERRLTQLTGQPIASLLARFPSAKERAHLQLSLKRAPDAKIQKVDVMRRYFEVTVGFTRLIRVYGGQTVKVPTQYRVWFRKNASLLAVNGSSKNLAELFAKTFLIGLAGEAVKISEIVFPTHFLQSFEHWLDYETHSRSGAILRAKFINATLDDEKPFDEIVIASQTLLNSATYKKLSRGKAQPVFVTFISPIFAEASRQLTCSLNFRGVLRIATAETSAEEANRLLDEFEGMFST